MTSGSTSVTSGTKRTSKMAKLLLGVFALGAGVFLSFQAVVYSEKQEQSRDVWGDDQVAIVQSNNQFSLRLFNTISNRNPQENAFISPLSVSAAMAMTLLGARGKTEEQLFRALSLDDNASRNALHSSFRYLLRDLNNKKTDQQTLRLANRIYLHDAHQFLDSFREGTQRYYGAHAQNVDFQNDLENSRNIINMWVKDATESKINELLKPGTLDALTRFVLVNAIYFKGNWERKFPLEKTQKQDFFVSETKKVTVDMMYQRASFNNGFIKKLDSAVLELPYAGSDLVMTIILPNKNVELTALEAKLNATILNEISTSLRNSTVDVYLPKFSLESDYNLVDILTSLGVVDLFGDNADLSGISKNGGLFVSHVIHKAFIDVTEDGSEAAASTAVVGRERSLMPREFRADRPFVYIISDKKTGSVIFMGRFVKPVVSEISKEHSDL